MQYIDRYNLLPIYSHYIIRMCIRLKNNVFSLLIINIICNLKQILLQIETITIVKNMCIYYY